MAQRSEEQLPTIRERKPLFEERYPDVFDWLDGNTWELEYGTDVNWDERQRFVTALRYQARTMDMELTVKTVHRDSEDGTRRKVLLIRAFAA